MATERPVHRTCWCGQPATHLQEVDPLVTPWDGQTRAVNLQPAVYKCDQHLTDSAGSAWCLPG
jgi:hypothetical protein